MLNLIKMIQNIFTKQQAQRFQNQTYTYERGDTVGGKKWRNGLGGWDWHRHTIIYTK